MTPLIQHLAKIASVNGKYDFFDYNWFDASNAVNYHFENQTQLEAQSLVSSPMPFPKMFVCSKIGNASILLRVEESETSKGEFLSVIGVMGFAGMGSTSIGTFAISKKNGSFQLVDIGQDIDKKELKNIVSVLAAFHQSLNDQVSTAYQPVIKNTYTNQRLIKKGKTPSFEWKTVTIESRDSKSQSLGGTHASPRLHDRRGHWRTMKKSGKKVWVRDCKVGDPSKGIIKHDYKFKPMGATT